ncbi:hypothetical protein B0J14DRAFT_642474 [Halenospora varia]|nr:hypothetical protein B0J14DRAFT_642474 [Halenospora varia]
MPLTAGQCGQVAVRTIQATLAFGGISLLVSLMKVPDQTFISDAFRNAIRFFLVIFVLEIGIRSCNIAMVFGMKPAAFVGPNKHLLLFVLEIVPFACWIGVTITMYTRLVERNCWKDFKGACVMFLPIGFFSIVEV